jgi:hypothetical protein
VEIRPERRGVNLQKRIQIWGVDNVPTGVPELAESRAATSAPLTKLCAALSRCRIHGREWRAFEAAAQKEGRHPRLYLHTL